jgi:hypothetical protein
MQRSKEYLRMEKSAGGSERFEARTAIIGVDLNF